MYAAMGEYDKAKQQYDLVMSGKGMEISNKKGKGKVSLQNQVRQDPSDGFLRPVADRSDCRAVRAEDERGHGRHEGAESQGSRLMRFTAITGSQSCRVIRAMYQALP